MIIPYTSMNIEKQMLNCSRKFKSNTKHERNERFDGLTEGKRSYHSRGRLRVFSTFLFPGGVAVSPSLDCFSATIGSLDEASNSSLSP